MIRSFRHRGLRQLFETGRTAQIDGRMHQRILARLDALDHAASLAEVHVPGWRTHALHGFEPTRYSIHVNGPWCITFEFEESEVYQVDFEQYH